MVRDREVLETIAELREELNGDISGFSVQKRDNYFEVRGKVGGNEGGYLISSEKWFGDDYETAVNEREEELGGNWSHYVHERVVISEFRIIPDRTEGWEVGV